MRWAVLRVYRPVIAIAILAVVILMIGSWFSFGDQKPSGAFVTVGEDHPFYFDRRSFGPDRFDVVKLEVAHGCSVRRKEAKDWVYRELPPSPWKLQPTIESWARYSCAQLNFEDLYKDGVPRLVSIPRGYGGADLVLPAFVAPKSKELLLLTDELLVRIEHGYRVEDALSRNGKPMGTWRPSSAGENTYVVTLDRKSSRNPLELARELYWREGVLWAQPNFVRIWQR